MGTTVDYPTYMTYTVQYQYSTRPNYSTRLDKFYANTLSILKKQIFMLQLYKPSNFGSLFNNF